MSSKEKNKTLGNHKRGKAFVISAPAGTGKTTLVSMLEKEFPCLVNSVSSTTRKIRPKEVYGVDYLFISEEEFKIQIEKGAFLEYAVVFDCYYGTSRDWVESKLDEGKHVIMVIDTQGARSLMGKYSLTSIFIKPPSIEELRRRLVERKTDCSQSIEKRLARAKKEMAEAKYYDYEIVNCNLEVAYQVLRSIIIAEKYKIKK